MPKVKTGMWRSIARRIRGNLVSGLIVVVPVVLTIAVFLTAINTLEEATRALLPVTERLEARLGIATWGIGLVVICAAMTAVGYLAKLTIGRHILALGEREVARFPVIRSVYNALKQLVVTVFEKSDSAFHRTCLIEFPYKDKWAVAFIAGDADGELREKTGQPDLIAVYMPTTPNPITGFLLFAPAREVVPLKLDMEEAAKLIISAGLIEPDDRPSRSKGRGAAGRDPSE